MERKTKVQAGDGQQDILITREFDLPVELLFRAHTEAELFEQWMSHDHGIVKVQKFDMQDHGGWRFQTSDQQGNVLFSANGVIHAFVPGQRIVRTFEMENTPFPVQLEFLDFESLPGERSKLSMQIVYRSAEWREQMLKLPFAQGLDMAHNRLEAIVGKLAE